MRRALLSLLACPRCLSRLKTPNPLEEVLEGLLTCPRCRAKYRVKEGIPDLTISRCLAGNNLLQNVLYSLYAPAYDKLEVSLAVRQGFTELELRREVASMLRLDGVKRFLEVCVGTGEPPIRGG